MPHLHGYMHRVFECKELEDSMLTCNTDKDKIRKKYHTAGILIRFSLSTYFVIYVLYVTRNLGGSMAMWDYCFS